MHKPILTIDRGLPIAWENLETMRIGFESAIVKLHDPSPAAQRFIELLRKGVQLEHLRFSQQHSGVTENDMQTLMQVLAPVLREVDGGDILELAPTPSVSVNEEHAKDPTYIYQLFAQHGFELAHNLSHADFVVHVERFLRPAQHSLIYHEKGIQHIPIRFTDRSIYIGPLVTPGDPLCLFCLELQQLQRTPELAIIAAQLCQKTPATENDATMQFAVHMVASLMRHSPQPSTHKNQLRFSVNNGVVNPYGESIRVKPHPECSCAN